MVKETGFILKIPPFWKKIKATTETKYCNFLNIGRQQQSILTRTKNKMSVIKIEVKRNKTNKTAQ